MWKLNALSYTIRAKDTKLKMKANNVNRASLCFSAYGYVCIRESTVPQQCSLENQRATVQCSPQVCGISWHLARSVLSYHPLRREFWRVAAFRSWPPLFLVPRAHLSNLTWISTPTLIHSLVQQPAWPALPASQLLPARPVRQVVFISRSSI